MRLRSHPAWLLAAMLVTTAPIRGAEAQEPPAHDGPSTDSARHGQEKKIAASAGPKAILAPSRGLSIIQGQNGTSELLGQPRCERESCRDGQGRRMSFYDPRHPIDLEPEPSLWRGPLDATRHVHASIMSWTLAALVEASGRGLTTSTDLHDWDGANAHHRPFAYAADLVFMSGSRLAGVEDAVVADVPTAGAPGSSSSWTVPRAAASPCVVAAASPCRRSR